MELLSPTLEWDSPVGVQTLCYVNIDAFKHKNKIYTKVPLNYTRNCLPCINNLH